MDISQRELPDLRHVLKDFAPGGNVLGLAFVDRDNPLSWAVLAHEYGHVLDDAEGISDQIIHGNLALEETRDEAGRMKVRWTAEIFADFVAAYVLGPVSLIPILLVEMMRRQLNTAEEECRHHPPTPIRLKVVREYLNKLGLSTTNFDDFFEVYEFDYAQKLGRMEASAQTKKSEVSKSADELLSSVADRVAARVRLLPLRPFSSERARTAKKLDKKLQDELPISCVRESSDDSVFAKLNSVGEGSSPNDVYAALESLNETPTNSAEILSAGWSYKLASFRKKLLQSLESVDHQLDPTLQIYDDYLTETDALLLKSLELAAVQFALGASPAGA